MQQLRRFAAVLVVARTGGDAREALQERLVRIGGRWRRRRGNGRCRVGFLPLAFVILLGDISEYELIAVAGDRPDKTRLARIVTEDTANRADGLTQRAVRDDDIAPDTVEDVAAMHRVAAPFDEEHEEIEVARNQRLFAAIAREHAAARRQ